MTSSFLALRVRPAGRRPTGRLPEGLIGQFDAVRRRGLHGHAEG